MARTISPEQQGLASFMGTANPRAIARFIEGNEKLQEKIAQNFEGLYIPNLLKVLRTGTKSHIESARDFLDRYIELNAGKIPLYASKITWAVRHAVTLPERIENTSLALKNWRTTGHRFVQGNPFFAWNATKALTETLAAGLSGLGLTVRERKWAMANISGWGSLGLTNLMTGAVMNTMMVAPSEAALTDAAQDVLDTLPQNEIASLIESTPSSSLEGLKDEIGHAFNPYAADHAHLENVPGLSRKEGIYRFTLGNETWTVPDSVAEAIALSSRASGLPPWIYFATVAKEASFNVSAFNENSGACGLAQFVPTTLYEYVFKYAQTLGYPHAASLVERYTKHRINGNPVFGYRPVSEGARTQLAEMCKDPELNIALKTVFMSDNIGRLQRNLAEYVDADYYAVKNHDLYVAHFAGMGRSEKMLTVYLTNQGDEKFAADFFPKHAREDSANRQLIYTGGDLTQPRTVTQFLDYIADTKHFGRTPLPYMGSRQEVVASLGFGFQQARFVKADTVTLTDNTGLVGGSPLPSITN